MKRLTKRLPNGVIHVDFAKQKESVMGRLAAIEDILGDEYDLNLVQQLIQAYKEGRYIIMKEPEQAGVSRLRELAQADREGRCGVPPVKLHQKIFRVFNGKIYEEIVCGAIWEPLMPQPRWKVFVMGGGLPYFWHEVFGKSVFLARAEAEAALRREQE